MNLEEDTFSLIAVSPSLTKRGSLCLNCLYRPYSLGWTPAFPLGGWNLWLPLWKSSSKNPGHWVSTRFPWLTTFYTYGHACCKGIRCILCASLGEVTWLLGRIHLVSLDLPMCLFSCQLSLVSYYYNKSQTWVQLHIESCDSSKWIFKPRDWSQDLSV